jgi:hypothetical protein
MAGDIDKEFETK